MNANEAILGAPRARHQHWALVDATRTLYYDGLYKNRKVKWANSGLLLALKYEHVQSRAGTCVRLLERLTIRDEYRELRFGLLHCQTRTDI